MATTKQTRKLYDIELIFSPNARNRYTVIKDGQATYPVGVTTVLKTLAKEGLMLWPMYEAINHVKNTAFRANGGVLDEILPAGFDGYDIYITHSGHLEGAEKAHTVKSTKGKDVGSEVHTAIEQALSAIKEGDSELLLMNVSKEAKPALSAFDKWFTELWPKVLATEQIVYSQANGYAGTFDALLEIDGKIVLCDVKTTNASRSAPLGIYPEYFVQLGGYSLAYHEENKYKPTDGPNDLMVINANKEGKLSTLRASDLGLSVEDCEQAWLNLYQVYKFIEPLKEKIKNAT